MQSETRKQKVGLHMSLMTKSDADDADDADDYIHIGTASGIFKIPILFIKSTSGFDIY